MKENHKKRVGVVYSTNPDYHYEHETHAEENTPAPEKQNLKLFYDSKRKGKGMTTIENFRGSDFDMKELAKQLKNHCGTGGSVKNGEILIQGDQREKLQSYLNDNNYKVKRKN
ncbi:MAG: translation initiation factor [Candidatus Marinimicrobia bacterium]|nr:translation initiation factor [Candidatus Neomarinimicrobiota bacterium]